MIDAKIRKTIKKLWIFCFVLKECNNKDSFYNKFN